MVTRLLPQGKAMLLPLLPLVLVLGLVPGGLSTITMLAPCVIRSASSWEQPWL